MGKSSTEPIWGGLLPLQPSAPTSPPESPGPPSSSRLATLPTIESGRELRILDFDVETVAAGFADPDWVPQKVTCVAWSWIGSDEVDSRVCDPDGLYKTPAKRAHMLEQLLKQIERADLLTGHNIIRFDIPVINSDAMRLGLEPVREAWVQDTMRLIRAKGFKKGQDNISKLLRTSQDKLPLSWQEWEDAYEQDGWATIRERAETDVIGHKEMRAGLLKRRLLRPPRIWRA